MFCCALSKHLALKREIHVHHHNQIHMPFITLHCIYTVSPLTLEKQEILKKIDNQMNNTVRYLQQKQVIHLNMQCIRLHWKQQQLGYDEVRSQ